MRFDLAALAARRGIRRKRIECRPIEARTGVELEYRRILLQILTAVQAFVRSDVLPVVEGERQTLTRDASGDRVGGVFGSLRGLISRLTGTAEMMVRRILSLEGQRHTERFRQNVRAAIGIDLVAVIATSDLDDLLSLAAERNVGLIRGLSEDVAKRVEQAILQNLTAGGAAKDLQTKLVEDFGIARRRAALIARDQTATLVSDMNRFRQQQAGVEKYRWQTSRDERVRATHRANEGKIFEWASPPSTGHPGHEVNCRCVAIAVIDLE